MAVGSLIASKIIYSIQFAAVSKTEENELFVASANFASYTRFNYSDLISLYIYHTD